MGVKKIVASTCNECKREYPIDNFYMAKGKFMPNKVVLYCKDCCNDMFKEYLKKTGSVELAMWYLCAKLDIPFIKKVFQRTESQVKTYQKNSEKDDEEYNWVLHYMNFLWGSQSLMKGADNWIDFTDTNVTIDEISGIKKSQEALQVKMDKLKLDWGNQDDIEDYNLLIYYYDKYTKNVEFENPQQEDLYRDLCLARLAKRKVEDGRSDEDSTKVQNRILTLMNKLKLDNFDDTKPKTASEKSFFAKIAQIETVKPCELYKEPKKYRDFNKLKKYERDMVLRPLLNTLCNMKDFNIDIDDIEQYNMRDNEE